MCLRRIVLLLKGTPASLNLKLACATKASILTLKLSHAVLIYRQVVLSTFRIELIEYRIVRYKHSAWTNKQSREIVGGMHGTFRPPATIINWPAF